MKLLLLYIFFQTHFHSMKKFKKLFLILLSLIIIILGVIYFYLLSTKPSYEGELKLKNLDKETTTYFDDFGVPHIYANSEKDAMIALGYIHAQDRL